MRTFVKGTLVGSVAVALAVYAIALSVSILADASGWASFQLDMGPLPLLDFERTSQQTAMTYGSGLGVLCVVLGMLNGAAAVLLHRRDLAGAVD